MRSRLLLVSINVAFVVMLGVSPAPAQKRNITEKDLFNFAWIGDPQISPDGSRVAFVRVTVNEKKDGYSTGTLPDSRPRFHNATSQTGQVGGTRGLFAVSTCLVQRGPIRRHGFQEALADYLHRQSYDTFDVDSG
jgi:hypothetical protein